MAIDKIDQLEIGSTKYDIDLPPDATPSIAGLTVSGAISEGGTSLVNKYLGKSAKSADSDKLDGNDSAYYLNYNNLTNTPSISNATVTVKQTGQTDQTFTLNGSAATINLADTNTWRPIGTGSEEAAAGNHTHGNITNAGTITSTAVTSATGVLVYDSTNKIQRATAAQTRSIIGAGTSNFSGSYNDLTNKPTIPATNIIPTTTTANKVLISTTTSGTAKWSDFNSAGFLKTNNSGVVSVDTSSYLTTSGKAADSSKLNGQEASYYAKASDIPTVNNGTLTLKGGTTAVTTFTANQSGSSTFSITAGSNVSLDTGTANTVKISATDTTYSAGTGLTLSSTTFSVSKANVSTMLNLLDTGSSTPVDADYYISQYVGGGTTTTSYHRRPMSALWSYIKGKGDATYLGKTATAADSAKLDGNDSAYYLNYNNLTGTPIPGDSGEIKTKYRCALKGYTGSGNQIWYYKLVKLPADNSGNYASAIINGRIGGWTASGMSAIYCLIWNRDGVGLALLDIGGTGTMSSIFDTVDLVVYKNSDNTADIYIRCKDFFTFDLDVEVYQSTASITYDGTYITTTPSGTESGKASTSTSRLELEKGVLKVNGTDIGYKILESLRKGSEADTAVGYYKIATINHHSWNFCDFCMLLKNSYAGTTYSTVLNCSCSDSSTELKSFKLNIITGTNISDKLAYLYTYDSNNYLTKIEVFIHATRFEHPTCYIINARPGQQLVIPTEDEFNKAVPDKPTDTEMTGYATTDNRRLLNYDLGVTIKDTITDEGWSMFNPTYTGYLLQSVRFNANSPLWGVGDYGSGIIFGGEDTKGVISLSWRLAQIKFAGGNSGNGGPVWWIGLTGTSTNTYDLDKLRAKPDRVTGSKAYSQANLTRLYDLIEAHKDIKFWTYKYTSGSDRTDMYSLMYNANYSGVLGTYSVKFYYISGGTVTELSSGTIYYEYLK